MNNTTANIKALLARQVEDHLLLGAMASNPSLRLSRRRDGAFCFYSAASAPAKKCSERISPRLGAASQEIGGNFATP